MMLLISFRKMLLAGVSSLATSGAKTPSATPNAIAIKIQPVAETLPRIPIYRSPHFNF